MTRDPYRDDGPADPWATVWAVLTLLALLAAAQIEQGESVLGRASAEIAALTR